MFASVMFAYVMFHVVGQVIEKSVVVSVGIGVESVLFVCVSSVDNVPPYPLDFNSRLLLA